MQRLITLILILLFFVLLAFGQDYRDEFIIGEKHTISSNIMGKEMLMFVYLPDDYYADSLQNYPVHYVLDAPGISNIFQGILRLHWMGDNVGEGIVVGLSADDRNYNMSLDQGAATYLSYLEREVIPFVDSTYRTTPYKILSGHSLSGSFTLFAAIETPGLFHAYIAGSPGPLEPLLSHLTTNNPVKNASILYSSVGSNDLTDTASFRELEEEIISIVGKTNVRFEIHPGETHFSNAVINLQKGLLYAYSDWKFVIPPDVDESVVELIKKHYNHLAEKYGVDVKPDEWKDIYPLMDRLAKSGDFASAIKLLYWTIELYPSSDQAYAFLAKAHFDTGQFEKGKTYLETALMLNPENRFALHMKEMLMKK